MTAEWMGVVSVSSPLSPDRLENTMSEPYSPIEVPDVWGHISRRWPTSTPFKQCAKVAEEAGEVVGAAIKLDEARRTEQDVLDELADTVIAAIAAIQARKRDPRRVVADRWFEVSQR